MIYHTNRRVEKCREIKSMQWVCKKYTTQNARTSSAGSAASGELVSDPGVAVGVRLLGKLLRYAVLVLHADVVILIEKLQSNQYKINQ